MSGRHPRKVARRTGGTVMANGVQQQRYGLQLNDPQLKQIWRNMHAFAIREGLSKADAARVAKNWVAQLRTDLQRSRS